MDVPHAHEMPPQHDHLESGYHELAKKILEYEATIALQASIIRQSAIAQQSYTCPHCGMNFFDSRQLQVRTTDHHSRSTFPAVTDCYQSLREDLSKTSPSMQKYVKSLEEAYQKQLQALAMDGLPAGAGSNFGLIPSENTPTRNPQSNMDGLTDVQPMTMADSPQKRKGGRKGGFISIRS